MEDIRVSERLYCQIENPSYVSVSRNQGFTFPYRDGKDFFSLVFIQRGALEYHFLNTETKIRVEKDQLLFIPKKTPYITKYLQDNTKIQMFTFNAVTSKPNSFKISVPMLVKSLDAILCFHSVTLQNMQNPLFLSAKIYELLYLCETQSNALQERHANLAPAINELAEYYFKNEKISYYAKLCNMSESNFRKLFKEHTGFSPIEYRNLIRIKNVKRFLASKEFTVAEAAYLAGFNNMAFFYEVYNRYK